MPAWQQQLPHGVVPGWHGAVPTLVGEMAQTGRDHARPGLTTAAAAAAPTTAPIIFSAPRREVERASWRDRSSKRSATVSSLVCADGIAQTILKRPEGYAQRPDALRR